MNLSPSWITRFKKENWEAIHWSSVGEATAADREILGWASERGYIVFTHDLDFGNLLASNPQLNPSVIQLRSQETSPDKMGEVVVLALRRMAEELRHGALVTIDASKSRVRILPLKK